MKSIRFELPVLSPSDVPMLLDLVTRVQGVVAAMVRGNTLEVVATSTDAGLLLREDLRAAMAAGAFVAA